MLHSTIRLAYGDCQYVNILIGHLLFLFQVELTGQPEKPYVKKKKSERKRE